MEERELEPSPPGYPRGLGSRRPGYPVLWSLAMRATITLELEITNSRRSSGDTLARARKGAESVVAWAERLRHVEVAGAVLEFEHRRPITLVPKPGLQTVDYGHLGAPGGGDADAP